MVSARDRLEGYRAALANAGIPFEDELLFAGDFSQPGGFTSGRVIFGGLTWPFPNGGQ
jgi:LacI family transcriptional regulator